MNPDQRHLTGPTAISEELLLRGYSAMETLRIERCVCGGSIVAPVNDWQNIAAAVRIHNLTELHQRYRGWVEAAQ